MSVSSVSEKNTNQSTKSSAWKFAVVGDTHVKSDLVTYVKNKRNGNSFNGVNALKEMVPYFIKDSVKLILFCGDIVQGGRGRTQEEFTQELSAWQTIVQPLYDKGIGIYPVRGNHENGVNNNITAWNNVFSGKKTLPQNGPMSEKNLTYSFVYKNAMFIGLDEYIDIHKVNQSWLDSQLANNIQPHVFVFGHEAAFKVFHSDCLDDYPTERNTFWQSLAKFGVKTYFCGHDHFFDVLLLNDGDNNSQNDVYQILVGGGGGWIMPRYNYNGDNAPFTPKALYHRKEHGYALVELNGDTQKDLEVTITWKKRTLNSESSAHYEPAGDCLKYSVFDK